MDFGDVVRAIKADHDRRFRRQPWTAEIFVTLRKAQWSKRDRYILYFRPGNAKDPDTLLEYHPSSEDILADDWEEVYR